MNTVWRQLKAVETSYSAIVNALNNIYEQTYEPEALGISRSLCKPSTVSAMSIVFFHKLPSWAELSQAERIDLTSITPLVDSTLNTLDNVILPAAKWVSELMDAKDEIEEATNIEITTESITTFQEQVAKLMLKANIHASSRFVSQNIVSSFSIFDPKKVPVADSSDLLAYGEDLWI